jgi:hypothetical protein
VGYRPQITLDMLLDMTIKDMCERLRVPVPANTAAA